MKGALFIISAPSGAGKTSLVKSLVEQISNLIISVSYTTRLPRPDEVDGKSYHFIDEATFQEIKGQDLFLEYACVFDNHYGTSREWVENKLIAGTNIILEIDWQGAEQVSKQIDSSISIFILPPSFRSLQERLSGRGEDEELVDRRMRDAKKELSHHKEYDNIVINDEFETAFRELKGIINEKKRNYRTNKAYFDGLVGDLLEQMANIQ